jgi:hypothetical protein
LDWPSAREDSPVAFTTATSLVHQLIEGRDEIRASWTVKSGPAVMKKARRSQSEKVFGTHKGLSLRQRGMPLNQGMAPSYQYGTQ